MKTADNSKMGQDFFKYLPSTIVVNILSRLPTRAAMECKCVCKPWLGLLATPEFVNAHMSRSAPGIAVEMCSPHSCKVIEFVDGIELNFDEKHGSAAIFKFDEEHRWEVTFNFRLHFDGFIISSANGLIFLNEFGTDGDDLILWNPITRDCINLPRPPQTSPKARNGMDNFGFGVSRTAGLYKVARIFAETPRRREGFKNACQVYTVGTGSWRNVPFGKPLRSLCVVRDCLCVSDISHFGSDISHYGSDNSDDEGGTPQDGHVIIWSMKGDDHSWTKIFVIHEVERIAGICHVWPIRIFENGDALMEWDHGMIFYYSNKTGNVYYEIVSLEGRRDPSTIMYAPSFVSLKSFAMENVSSF
ncbi:putative F-box protein [Salvia divinorum]|uniref:F-box protein n=1 Tax=Salvia divinorum TaxID=28513 RepID=A0ABD1HMC1_SALDI